MIEIGGRPILWHIMKIYTAPRHQRFHHLPRLQGLCHQGIFLELLPASCPTSRSTCARTRCRCITQQAEPWTVTLVDTGEDTMTGGRIKRILPYVGDDRRLLPDLWRRRRRRRHPRRHRLPSPRRPPRDGDRDAAARPLRRLAIEGDRVTGFQEKPRGDGGWINGGFFVLSPKVGDYIEGDADGLGTRADGASSRRTASSASISTPASGSRWIRCATSDISKTSGRADKAPWKKW